MRTRRFVPFYPKMGTSFLEPITQLFLQQPCPLCDRSTPQPLCQTCWRQLESVAINQPAVPTEQALPVLAWGYYQGVLKHAIAALKYRQHRQLAFPLGRALGQCWQRVPIMSRQPPLVIPIPMHRDKRQARGFDQAELLAAAFCQQANLPLIRQGLIRARATAPQFGLGVTERQHNLAGAFALGDVFLRRRPRAPALLLDDIYTTGTTVRAAAATLRRCGISVCGVVALARATLHE